ncbi:MAG TPA: histidine triad nucleotide-binding protein [Dehalococcoidia bacterium]|nr:histidine triad nucleotide-binding protein [Dehalococcoidia bacterium]
MDCIFCKIVNGEIPSDIVYRDEEVFAFRDINPQAPVHILVVPVRHIASLAELTETDAPLVGHMVHVASQVARQEGIAERGYRLAISCGREGGQAVPHLHLHLLGGRQMADAMG